MILSKFKKSLACGFNGKFIITNVIFLILFLLIQNSLQAKLWETYTNTNHVTDAVMTADKIYTATWGGVVEYNLNSHCMNMSEPLPVWTDWSVMTCGL